MQKIKKTEAEWREQLTPEQYQICRQKGTERAFTGKYNSSKEPGTYACICCNNPLFDSNMKFDSGTGWPSFFAPVNDKAMIEEEDIGFLMRRTEVLCAKCDAHLGHVFTDGPPPTGLRYCMNSTSLILLSADLQKAENN